MIRNLKIQQKLAASFSLILLTVLAHSVYGWMEGIHLINAATDLQEKDYSTSRDGLILEDKFANLGKIYVDSISFGDVAKLEKAREIERDFIETIAHLKKYEMKDIQTVLEMETSFNNYTVVSKNLVTLIMAKKDPSEIEKRMNDFAELNQNLKNKIKNYTAEKDKVFRDNIAVMQQRIKTFNQITAAITFVILIAGITLSVIVARSISTRLTSIIALATKIAEGDFTHRYVVNSQDEIGILSASFIKMSDRLSAMIKNIREVTHHVASATDQIGKNTRTVMEGAKAQASSAETGSSSIIEMNSAIMEISSNVESLSSSSEITSSSILEMSTSFKEVTNATDTMVGKVNETSSSIVEMASAIKEVSQNVQNLSSSSTQAITSLKEMNTFIKEIENHSKESASLSEKVKTDAEQFGMTAVEETIDGMRQIKETVQTSLNVVNKLGQRSEQIGKILNVIDEVTKQTNLLALNAAILAAQAGEQGKGFGIVAEEIKNLADRTNGSTLEISQLINDVRKEVQEAIDISQSGFGRVEKGIHLSLNAREALNKILESSHLSSAMSLKIEKATSDHTVAAQRITRAMEQINGMVQQISAASLQQKKGSEQILHATEMMENSTHVVQRSIQEQSMGTKQISDSVENVNERVQQILRSIKEQKKGTETFVGVMENINQTSSSNLRLTEEMSTSVQLLSGQVSILKKEVDKFII